jgi:hypothetical protein
LLSTDADEKSKQFIFILQRGDHKEHHQEINKIGRTNAFSRCINEYSLDPQITSVPPTETYQNKEVI